jgi:hypothetical protein
VGPPIKAKGHLRGGFFVVVVVTLVAIANPAARSADPAFGFADSESRQLQAGTLVGFGDPEKIRTDS